MKRRLSPRPLQAIVGCSRLVFTVPRRAVDAWRRTPDVREKPVIILAICFQRGLHGVTAIIRRTTPNHPPIIVHFLDRCGSELPYAGIELLSQEKIPG